MSEPKRLHTVDAMRGIAAMAVVFYHIHTPAFSAATGGLINFLTVISKYGFLGVPVFFAISGFVISASMERVRGVSGFGQFMAKRSVRLDPAYWSSIALDVGLTWLAIQLALPHTDLPNWPQLALHLIYLQDLAGVPSIVAIYWTLCLEIQFYLIFGLIITVGGRYRTVLFGLVTFYAMLVAAGQAPNVPGLFLSHWCMFIIGAAAHYYGVNHRSRWREFLAIIGALGVVLASQVTNKGLAGCLNLAAATATALFFYVGAMRNQLSNWLNNRPLRYLGSRSYALYLFHAIVGERAAKLATVVIGEGAANPAIALAIFVTAVVVSVITAELAFRIIEAPTHALARSMFRNKPAALKSPLEPTS